MAKMVTFLEILDENLRIYVEEVIAITAHIVNKGIESEQFLLLKRHILLDIGGMLSRRTKCRKWNR